MTDGGCKPAVDLNHNDNCSTREPFRAAGLADNNTWRSYSMKRGYSVYLRRWILPSRRNYKLAMEQFIAWYCSEPRLALNRTVVLRFRLHLESLGLAAGNINQRLLQSGVSPMRRPIQSC
jgi:hypothetical protein